MATELLMLGGALAFMPRGLVDRSLASLSGRLVAAGICLAVVTAEFRPVSLPLAVVAGAIAFVAAAVALGVLRRADFWTVRQLGIHALARRSVG